MALLQEFKDFVVTGNLFSSKDKLLLAVSGGLDSVVLCELCQQAGYDFTIAHCNFRLRGEESDRDEQFVRGLGKKYHKETLVKHFDTEQYAALKKVSIQVAARELRYDWFFELVHSAPFTVHSSRNPDAGLRTPDYIVTAHHLDDNVETMLMNFFKGTGITGLRGMLPKQDKLVRPLLFARKESLKSFAEENKLGWMEDSSNESDKYTRNYFRHHIIPMVESIYPGAENNLAGNLQRFREAEQLYRQAIEQHKKKLVEIKGEEVHIPVLKLKKSAPLPTIVYETTREYGFGPSQVNDIIGLLDAESGKYIASSTHRIIKNRQWLIIAPLAPEHAETILIETPGLIEAGMGTLELKELRDSSFQIPTSFYIACLDASKISFPLLLRKWKPGDYFYPLGMKKKKKLSRFFIDQKLSKTEKEKIWVLEANKKIVWVIGQRIDDRFKITPSTTRVLQITYTGIQV